MPRARTYLVRCPDHLLAAIRVRWLLDRAPGEPALEALHAALGDATSVWGRIDLRLEDRAAVVRALDTWAPGLTGVSSYEHEALGALAQEIAQAPRADRVWGRE